MRERKKRSYSLGVACPRAPWRRAARPLAVVFCLQLSGVGCARPAPAAAPTRPNDLVALIVHYEDQLEGEGITLEDAEDYVSGRSASPLPEPEDTFRTPGRDATDVKVPLPNRQAVDGTPSTTAAAAASPAQGTAGEPTFKIVDGVAEYRIGPGDVISVTPYLGPETPTPTSLRVQADGNIYLARFNIGAVAAAGSTPTELTRALTGSFRRFVPTGYVEVRIEEYNAWSATLTGEIRDTPNGGAGNYPIDGRITLSEFINSYGGPTDSADLGDVRIVRQGGELLVDLSSVLAGTLDDPTLLAGDVVHVPSIRQGSSRMFIFGEVREPGVYTYTEGISVLDAIAQAGGWTETAKRDAVYVSRPTTGEVIPVNLDTILGDGQARQAPPLEPGDFVVVPFSPDRSQKIRDWVGIASLILSAITILELTRRN